MKVFLILALTAALPVALDAQSPDCRTLLPYRGGLVGAWQPLGRSLELAGATKPTSGLAARATEEADPRHCLGGTPGADTDRVVLARALPIAAETHYNNAYPRGNNDGAIWQGVGFSGAFSAGAAFRRGMLSAALQPILVYAENGDFRTVRANFAGFDSLVNPWYGSGIDLPQRFGSGAFAALDLGQSYIRLDTFGVALGVSNENIRWGPALRYPLMFSYNAPGFPHVFLETTRGLNIGIGHIEAHALVGRLTESKYFDTNPANDHREVGAVLIGLQPRGLDGLSLGVASVFEQNVPPGGLAARDYLTSVTQFLPFNAGSNNPGNELASVYARWAFPQVGFEVYVDWAHDDYAGDALDFLMEPDYSQAYTLGVGKVIPGEHRWFYLTGELTHLEASLPLRGGRGVDEFYYHGTVIQGHTQQGQLLGAFPGPGSDAQYLAADMFTSSGSLGIYTERIRHNEDVYYATFARYFGSQGHDVELTGGLRGSRHFGQVLLNADLNFGRRWNRDFIDGLLADPTKLGGENNVAFMLGLSWAPARPLWARRGRTRPTSPADGGPPAASEPHAR